MESCAKCGKKTAPRDAFCRGCNRFLIADRPFHLQNAGQHNLGLLISMWIVIYVVGLMIFGVAYGEMKSAQRAVRYRAESAVSQAAPAAARWRSEHAGACPTWERLVEEKEIVAGYYPVSHDPWEHPYRIECMGEDTVAVSDGPDGIRGTGDDVTADGRPPMAQVNDELREE